jgi:gamma-glutamyltranspeptidase / glutathione hydrolase
MRTYKQEVVASRGVVAANHPLAGAAGVEVLAAGGNAVDAAVACLFTLSVVEPMMVGPLGAGFFVHRRASGQVVTLDDYAVVPGAAHETSYDPLPGGLENETVDGANAVGHRAAAVPGALAGWCAMLEAEGTMPLAEVLAPAIRHADTGYRATPYLAQAVAETAPLGRFPASAAVFLPGGSAIGPGDRVRPGELAATLRLIAEGGPDVLYRGPVGAAVVAECDRAGGWISAEDLTAYRLHWREPIGGRYRGAEITAMRPASSGGTHVVQILNLLEGFDLAGMGFGTVASTHLFLEALKLAFADRGRYLADPEWVDVPADWLASPGYAAQRRPDLRPDRAGSFTAGVAPGLAGEGNCTTHVTVADGDGGLVTTTQTINSLFGSCVTVPGTGLLLNNCMQLMDPNPGRTNSVAPGKRVLSSMSPTIVSRHGRPWFALGTPGGNRIFAAVTQAIINVVDHGMTLQQAVEAPRVWTLGATVQVEDTFADLADLVGGLERLGHRVEVVPKVAGGMNGVLVDDDGMLHGAACWRADGSPMGLSGGLARMAGETLPLGPQRRWAGSSG